MKAKLFLSIVSFVILGCTGIQANPTDPKAPVISLKGFEPPALEMKNGNSILKFGQRYRLVANVEKKAAPIVRVYRRLNYSVNNRGWWATNFNPIQLTVSDCCPTVWIGWYWGPENTQKDSNHLKLEAEMWVVDADGTC